MMSVAFAGLPNAIFTPVTVPVGTKSQLTVLLTDADSQLDPGPHRPLLCSIAGKTSDSYLPTPSATVSQL